MKQCKLLLIGLLLFSTSMYAQRARKVQAIENTKNVSVMKAIENRKSVRTFSDKEVTKEDLMTLLKAGMAAPSAMNRQPWVFVVITEKDMIGRLIQANPNNEHIFQTAKAAIVVCADMKKAIEGEGRDFWIQDCSAATENILIQAEEMGLGAVWTGVYPLKERVLNLQKALNLPENIVPLNVIPLGWQTGAEKPKDKFNEKAIYWNKF